MLEIRQQQEKMSRPALRCKRKLRVLASAFYLNERIVGVLDEWVLNSPISGAGWIRGRIILLNSLIIRNGDREESSMVAYYLYPKRLHLTKKAV